MSDSAQQAILARWRLVLGKFAQSKLPDCLSGSQQKMADALDSLYSREYRGRGGSEGTQGFEGAEGKRHRRHRMG